MRGSGAAGCRRAWACAPLPAEKCRCGSGGGGSGGGGGAAGLLLVLLPAGSPALPACQGEVVGWPFCKAGFRLLQS